MSHEPQHNGIPPAIPQSIHEMADLFLQFAAAERHVLWVVEAQPVERVSFVSPAFETVWGRPAQGMYDDPRLWAQCIHDDDRPAVVEAFGRWLADPDHASYDVEYRIVRPDGSVRWIHDVGHAGGGARPVTRVTGFSEDITERKRTEQALLDSRAHLSAVFEHMTEGVMLCSPEGRLVGFNAAALAMHDMTADTATGLTGDQVRTMYELRHLDGTLLRNSQWPLSRVMRGETLRQHELRIHHRGQGWHKVFAYSGARVDDESGRTLFGVLQCADVTPRRHMEDEVERMNAELERRVAERTAELQAAVKELEAFSYSVSHDLRTPLRALDGFSQALIEDHGANLPAEGRRYLGIIRDTAQKMGVLIDDLLEFSRLGRQALTRRSVDTAKLARHAYESLAPQCQGRRIELSIGDLPGCEADPALLRQVWVNLLGNAVKYTRQREVATIEVGHEIRDGVAEYFVRDNGAGFDMRYAHKLFGVFERLHRADEFEGTGVGLAIVQRIVQRHGGRVRAQGEPGRGASFHFTLG